MYRLFLVYAGPICHHVAFYLESHAQAVLVYAGPICQTPVFSLEDDA